LEYLKYIKTLDLAKNIIVFYNRGTISEKLELTISSTVKIKDFDTMWLLREIIESFSSSYSNLFERKGVPIGNLASQLFANVYLNEFDQITISIITYYEIIAGLKFKKAEKQLIDFEDFVNNNTILHISEDSIKLSAGVYADLRHKGITIGTSDILIAGIALYNGLTLITNNLIHYEAIPGLLIANWKN